MEYNASEYQGIVGDKTRQIFEVVLVAFLTGIVCLLGIVFNVINIIMFYKQGLTTTMNISFFALAISDVFSVATMGWIVICLNPLFINSLPHWDTLQVTYLTAAWPHLCFGRITCWITTYITAERCLCIAMPLNIKQIVTPKRTTIIICFLYLINLAAMIPIYLSSYLDWKVVPETNITRLTMVERDSRSVYEPIAFMMYAVLGTASFPVVILFTAVLVYKLRRQRTWRRKSAGEQNQKTLASKREVRSMHMVVFIAFVLIICYTPGVTASLTTFFVPSFNVVGAEANSYLVLWSFGSLLQAVNSSVNIFFYYKMSSKYKQTFHKLFCRSKSNDVNIGDSKRETFTDTK